MDAVISVAADQEKIISRNPATNEEIGRVEKFSVEDVENSVADSRRAFQLWRNTSFSERKKTIMRARKIILAEIDDIARLVSDEMGKPVAEAISAEITPVLDLMQYFARNAEKMLAPRKINIGTLGLMGRTSKIVYQPLGVIGIISPWNFPFSIPLGEVVMALMAGNTVVLKPSELTPLVGEKIGEIFEKANLPKNVLQILTGDGETGAALVESAPDKIMFTGSVITGRKIAAAAAKNLTPVVLELGGKDPMIVFADADLEAASSGAVWGAFTNSGQACSSVERLYVEESVKEKMTNLIVEKTKNLKQSYGCEDSADIGSMVSEDQLKTVENHVADFEISGAEILTGGRRNENFAGAFFEPTVIANADNSMKGMRDETFGPTLPIASFKTEDEAIELANDTEFGLTASVWTTDLSKGKRVAEKIRAGTVTVNEVLYTHGIGQTPWGGFKNSGYGRTHGLEGLMELVAPQHIHVNRFTFLPNVWWFGYSENASKTFKQMAKYFAGGSFFQTLKLAPQMLKRIKEMKNKKT